MNNMTGSKLTNTSPYRYSIYGLLMSLFIGASIQSATADELAIEGYDPVAYFKMHEATMGSETIRHEWIGKQWRFVNEEHKELFVADPMSYMPNYGGYCSYDPVSAKHDHQIDPTAWRIVESELYLFYSEQDANHAMPTEAWDKVKAGLSQ
jgi:YHS domain-containing protein